MLNNLSELTSALNAYLFGVHSAQEITSARTSVNSARIPALFNNRIFLQECSGFVFDFGCGSYIEHIDDYFSCKHIVYLPFDPYNRTLVENQTSLLLLYEWVSHGVNFSFTCSNVLNVIQNDEIVKKIVSISSLFDQSFFTVYEGDKSGIGKLTKPDCYQRNQKISEYLDFFPSSPFYCDSKIIYDFESSLPF